MVRDHCVNELHIISWKFKILLGSKLKVGTFYSLLSHQVSENVSLHQYCFKDRIVRYLSFYYLPAVKKKKDGKTKFCSKFNIILLSLYAGPGKKLKKTNKSTKGK